MLEGLRRSAEANEHRADELREILDPLKMFTEDEVTTLVLLAPDTGIATATATDEHFILSHSHLHARTHARAGTNAQPHDLRTLSNCSGSQAVGKLCELTATPDKLTTARPVHTEQIL